MCIFPPPPPTFWKKDLRQNSTCQLSFRWKFEFNIQYGKFYPVIGYVVLKGKKKSCIQVEY